MTGNNKRGIFRWQHRGPIVTAEGGQWCAGGAMINVSRSSCLFLTLLDELHVRAVRSDGRFCQVLRVLFREIQANME